MTTDLNDGGPAFPVPDPNDDERIFIGMSLRDYFAAAALSILAAIPVHEQGDDEELAEQAWSLADAMLRAREQQETPE